MTATTTAEPAARGAARGGLANMAGSALAGVTGVVVTWTVARTLGPEPAGAFFAATATFVLIGGLSKLGTGTGLVYWPARLRATGQGHLLGPCLRAGLLPVIAFALFLSAAMWLAAPWIAQLTAGDAGAGPALTAEHITGLRVLAVFVPMLALTDVLLTVTRGYRRMRPTVMLDRVLRSVLQLLAVATAGVATLWTTATLPVFTFAWASPYLPVAVLAGLAARTAYRRGFVVGEVTGTDRRRLRRDFWVFTGPRAVAAVAQLALQRVDVLLVAALGGLAPAAVYAVAGRFVVLIQFANQGLSQSVQPRLAEALSTGDHGTARRLYQIATGWLVLVTWPVCLLVIAFAPRYLRLFGEGYAAGVPVVLVLATTMLVATGCGMVDMVLAMAGRTSANLGNVLIALAVTIGLDVLLIPRWGALGAALGLAGAMLVNNLLPLAQVYRGTRLHPFGTGTLGAAALAVGCFGVVVLVPAAVVVAVPAYAAGAWLLRGPLMLGAFRRKS